MKLSLAWIFDHIDADWHTFSIPDLVAQCTSSIAELEQVKAVSFDLHSYSLARIISSDENSVRVQSPEWAAEYTLAARVSVQVDQWYLIHKDDNQVVRWATLSDFGGSKDGLLPACMVAEAASAGGWKKSVESKDYLLEIDNKSINNRPDLWGHRGFAREIATMLLLPLKPENTLFATTPVRSFDGTVSPTAQNPIGITLKDTDHCSRMTGVYIDNITVQPCDLAMALRLVRVDSKPINYVVDLTNYVMLDIGQPMHAYDAKTINSGMIAPRFAHAGDKLQLLDGQTITLNSSDFVICDGQTPIGLAGIMGGAKTAITDKTTSLFVESACFDATMIRHTAMNHKLRTEASARFEKSLDPEQTHQAILRMIKLAQDGHMAMKVAPYILSLGSAAKKTTLLLSHGSIETTLGTSVPVATVKDILERLGFGVVYKQDTYEVLVPSFRATKDITLKQDIVEEIGRFVGYQSIEPVLPKRITQPVDVYALMRMRRLRNHLAYALCMHELASYAFFDEQFLRELSWQPTHTIEVANPLSEQWYRLVTSLMPNMIRAIVHNSADHDTVRFFECAKIWNNLSGIQERSVVAGVLFDKKNPVDFYEAQKELQSLFDVLDMTPVTWHRIDAPEQAWFMPHQTADIKLNDHVIGRAGKINPTFLHAVTEGDAFIFELDATFLKHFKPTTHRYQALSKYPDVVRDVSLFVPVEQTAESLKALIHNVHAVIVSVDLVDCFHKAEWADRKALTFRYVLRDTTKTFTKDEVDDIAERIVTALQAHGAQIR